MNDRLVLFRVDGTSAVGIGHLSRCLALAEALEELGVRSKFAGCFEDAARALLDPTPFERIDSEDWTADGLARLAQEHQPRGIILDDYRFGEEALHGVGAVARLILIDDFARLPTYRLCRVIVNFTVGATGLDYRDANAASKLLGPAHLLLRRAMRRAPRKQTAATTVRKVLLSFGGGESGELSIPVLRALLQVDGGLMLRLVTGRPVPAAAQELLGRFPNGAVHQRNLRDLAEAFAWADACVSGGGLTKYEAAFCGVPVAVVSRTAHEAEETRAFAAAGLAIDLGSADDPERLSRGLSQLVNDETLRHALVQRSSTTFPDDPTKRVATGILAALEA
jgi:spore coat polysaccharide biosynthesis predicted glycosyltransferase SpsG